MFPALVLVAAVAAAPAREPIAVAAPDLSLVNLEQNRASFYTEYFAQELTRAGVRVVTAKQIAAVLGMERQRQLLNCSDTSNDCMAELANALGTDAILIGTIARIGRVYQVNLSIVASRDGATLSTRSIRVKAEEELLDELAAAAPGMAAELAKKLRPVEVAAEQQPRRSEAKVDPQPPKPEPVAASPATEVEEPAPPREYRLRRWAWAPAAGAVVLGVGGGALFAASDANYRKLSATPEQPITLADAQRARDDGKLQQSLAVGAFVAGGVALAVAGTMAFLPSTPADSPDVAVTITPSGGALVLSGSFP